MAGIAITVSAKKKYAVTMTGENLATLTQVTDNEEPCLDPFGGDNGSALFFSVRETLKMFPMLVAVSVCLCLCQVFVSFRSFYGHTWGTWKIPG